MIFSFLYAAGTLLVAGRFTSAQDATDVPTSAQDATYVPTSAQDPTYAPTSSCQIDGFCALLLGQEAPPAETCAPDDVLDPNPACFRPSLATQACQFKNRCPCNGLSSGNQPQPHDSGFDLPGIASRQELADETYFPAWSCTAENGCNDMTTGPRGKALLLTPEVDEGLGAVLYIHGGSWLFYSPMTGGYPELTARISREWKMPVLSIDYPLAPVGDAAAMLDAAARGLAYLGENYPGRRLVVSGDSSGGGTALVASTAQASHLESFAAASRGHKISATVLYSPWINLLCNAPTYFSQNFCSVQNGADSLLFNGDVAFFQGGDTLMKDFQDNARTYLGNDDVPLNDPIFSPLFFQPNQMHWDDLPQIQIHMASTEVLQADCSMYADRVCGVSNGAAFVGCHQYDGMMHVWQMSSEGCGSGEELVLANASMRSSKNFVMDVVKDTSYSRRVCGTVMHYEYPRGWDSVEYFESLGDTNEPTPAPSPGQSQETDHKPEPRAPAKLSSNAIKDLAAQVETPQQEVAVLRGAGTKEAMKKEAAGSESTKMSLQAGQEVE